MKTILREQRGFTLIELAMVLVIVGLLLGGVLKGKSMVDDAKKNAMVNLSNGMISGIYTYQGRYGYLPGDDPQASIHVGVANQGDGDGSLVDATEGEYMFQHLAAAGIISGSYDGTKLMTHKYGGTVDVTNTATADDTSPAGNVLKLSSVPDAVAQFIDTQIDDSVSSTGSVRSGTADYGGGASRTTYIGL